MPTLWITRTQPSAQRLSEAFAETDVTPWIEPLIDIVPLPGWEAQSVSASQPSLVIVTSQHAAAQYVASNMSTLAVDVVHVALGAVTAATLEAAGFAVELPTQQSSEGVVAMEAVNRLQRGCVVWLIAGEGGRNVLQDSLARQGVRAVKFATYRRQPVSELMLDEVPDLVEISSRESLDLAFKLLPAVSDSMLVVASLRLFNAAVELGATKLQLAGGAEVSLMKEAVKEAVKKALLKQPQLRQPILRQPKENQND